ncbi:uncharacterized protein LOC133785707 [Humulus lupulus]|uniref:uncharacterized protein LOC133785707 n=1 Tax=Humulus lupulus TaxID=3486 RepID=UPI002B4070CB|nr:uncharacterized protein LOC133785707 [Humulus lupulus]
MAAIQPKINGHVKDKCLVFHLKLKPKNHRKNQGRNDKKATLTVQQVEELSELKQPNTTLALMTMPTTVADTYNRGKLFHLNIQVKQSVVQTIVDPVSQKNLISEALVRKAGPQDQCAHYVTLSLVTLTPSQNSDIRKLQKEIFDLFENVQGLPPQRAIEHEIQLVRDSPLPNLGLYRTSLKESEEIKKQVQGLLEQGVIKPSCSPCCSLVLLEPKKDGGWRMCVDYRGINRINNKNQYPLPRIDVLLDQLDGGHYFTKLDLKS